MNQRDKATIAINTPISDFSDFIEIEDNHRIFFSARFGTGKTYFLEKFFENKAEEYDDYFLSVAKYQILSNEDVLDFIRYDLLVKLEKRTSKQKKSSDKNGGLLSHLKYLACDQEGLELIISNIPKIGKPLIDILRFKDRLVEIKNNGSDATKLEQTFKEKIKDNNNITHPLDYPIHQTIEDLKGGKKSMLIVDDLDRIDPEHIFRILNVFGVYMDSAEDNKFGFDYVVLVGDVNNIKYIFKHKYGQEVDFQGYFDKFFSFEPYRFNNEKTLLNWIESEFFELIKHNPDSKPMQNHGTMRAFMECIIKLAIQSKQINLRQIYIPTKYKIKEAMESYYDPLSEITRRGYFIFACRLLSSLFVDQKNGLIQILEDVKKQPNLPKEIDEIYNIIEQKPNSENVDDAVTKCQSLIYWIREDKIQRRT